MILSSVWPVVNTVYKENASKQRVIITQEGNEEMMGAWVEQSCTKIKEEKDEKRGRGIKEDQKRLQDRGGEGKEERKI